MPHNIIIAIKLDTIQTLLKINMQKINKINMPKNVCFLKKNTLFLKPQFSWS